MARKTAARLLAVSTITIAAFIAFFVISPMNKSDSSIGSFEVATANNTRANYSDQSYAIVYLDENTNGDVNPYLILWDPMTNTTKTPDVSKTLLLSITGESTDAVPWSDAKQSLVFASEQTGDLRILTADSAVPQTLLAAPDFNTFYGSPSWSSDGSKIAFITRKEVPGDTGTVTLFSVNILDIAPHTIQTLIKPDSDAGYASISWSLDGQYLAVEQRILNPPSNNSRILVVSTTCDASTLSSNTAVSGCIKSFLEPASLNDNSYTTPAATSIYGEQWDDPVWSLDGKSVFFSCSTGICSIAPDDTHFQRLLDAADSNSILSLSFDGKYLLHGGNSISIYDFEAQRDITIVSEQQINNLQGAFWVSSDAVNWLENSRLPSSLSPPTALVPLQLQADCSFAPERGRNWFVINPNHQAIAYTFEVYDKSSGQVQEHYENTVAAAKDNISASDPVSVLTHAGSNSVRVYVNGALQTSSDGSTRQCHFPTP